jgi:hypothetical protein
MAVILDDGTRITQSHQIISPEGYCHIPDLDVTETDQRNLTRYLTPPLYK